MELVKKSLECNRLYYVFQEQTLNPKPLNASMSYLYIKIASITIISAPIPSFKVRPFSDSSDIYQHETRYFPNIDLIGIILW